MHPFFPPHKDHNVKVRSRHHIIVLILISSQLLHRIFPSRKDQKQSDFFYKVLIEIEMSERLDKKSAETENKSLAAAGPGIVMRRNIMR